MIVLHRFRILSVHFSKKTLHSNDAINNKTLLLINQSSTESESKTNRSNSIEMINYYNHISKMLINYYAKRLQLLFVEMLLFRHKGNLMSSYLMFIVGILWWIWYNNGICVLFHKLKNAPMDKHLHYYKHLVQNTKNVSMKLWNWIRKRKEKC